MPSATALPNTAKRLSSYGRIIGRPLTARQSELVETLLPSRSIANYLAQRDPVRPCILEIGFGAGEHLTAIAAANPQADYIGCEPFMNGVGSCLATIADEALANIWLHADDARDVLNQLPAASLDQIYLLFPDPWPKTKHHKRRIMQQEFLGDCARLLKPGGSFRFASDHADYVSWVLMHMQGNAYFSWANSTDQAWLKPYADWPGTRYEQKAQAKGSALTYLEFAKQG